MKLRWVRIISICIALHEGQIELPIFSINDSSHANLYELFNTDVLNIDNIYFKGFRYGLYSRNINEKCIIHDCKLWYVYCGTIINKFVSAAY
jgi:hypothetical protein